MRTGTLALATLSIRSRSDCIVSKRPKTTDSGGISPNEVIRELTEVTVVMGILIAVYCDPPAICTPTAKLTQPHKNILLRIISFAFSARCQNRSNRPPGAQSSRKLDQKGGTP